MLTNILTWLGIVLGGLAVAGVLLVATLAWLLNRPIDDNEQGRTARRC